MQLQLTYMILNAYQNRHYHYYNHFQLKLSIFMYE